MSIYKFVRPSRYFNGVCSSTLLYEDKDGDKKRLPCVTETCIDAYFSGTAPITSCRNLVLPSGYKDRLYTWGVEGGPWTMNVSYSEHFPYSNNEFCVHGARLTTAERPLDANARLVIGNYPYFQINPSGFSHNFQAVDPGKTGYTAMESQSLNGYQIDPSKIGGSYDPVTTYFPSINQGCGVVQVEKLYRPTIEYFNVGTNADPPSSNIVIFNYALVQLSGIVFPYTQKQTATVGSPGWTYWQTYFKNAEFQNIAQLGTTQTWIDGIHPGPIAQEYLNWAYSGVPNVNRDISFVSQGITDSQVKNARVYHPRLDKVETNGGPLIRGLTYAPHFHTGYRMQRFVQDKQQALFAQNNSYLWFGVRHIETRMYPYGYYANWTVTSIEPQLTFGQFSLGSVAGFNDWYLLWGSWARAKITLNITYKSFVPLVPAKFKYEYGAERLSNPYNCMERKLESPDYNEPIEGWDWEVMYCNLRPDLKPGTPSPTVIQGTHCLYNGFSTGSLWNLAPSHYASTQPTDLGPLDPRSPQKVNYYTWPLTWSSGNFTMFHTSHYVLSFDPSRISYRGVIYPIDVTNPNVFKPYTTAKQVPFPGTPDNFKFWRRLI